MNSISTSTHSILFFIKKYIENWVMLALVTFLLGYFFFPSSSKHNTFFYIAVCVPAVLLFPVYLKQLKPDTWVMASALILVFYLFLNSLWSIHYSTAQSLKYLRYAFTLYCLFVAVFILYYKKNNCSKLLLKLFIIIGFFYSIYGVYVHFSTLPQPLMVRYNDPIDSSMLVGLLLLTCIWSIASSKSWKKSAIYLVLLIPFVIVMLLAKARGPQLALILTLPLIFYFQSQSIKKFITSVLIVIIACGLLLQFSNLFNMLFSRGMSDPYRMEIWSISFYEALDYFWFGQGTSHEPMIVSSDGTEFFHSHNILLSIFRLGGIVGALIFCTNFVLCFFAGLKLKSSADRVWIVWLFFGVLCLMTNGKYPLTRPSAIWLSYWVPMAFICAAYSNYFSEKHINNERKA